VEPTREKRSFSTAGKVLVAVGVLVLLLVVGAGWAVAGNYDNLGNLVRVVALLRTQAIYHVDTAQLVQGAIEGMVDSLNDPYSVYMDKSNFTQLQQQIQGSFAGLGMVVTIPKPGDYLIVKSTIAGTPAQRAGIGANDAILKIDNRDTKGMDVETAVSLLRGPAGSSVTLTIARGGPGGAVCCGDGDGGDSDHSHGCAGPGDDHSRPPRRSRCSVAATAELHRVMRTGNQARLAQARLRFHALRVSRLILVGERRRLMRSRIGPVRSGHYHPRRHEVRSLRSSNLRQRPVAPGSYIRILTAKSGNRIPTGTRFADGSLMG